MMIDSIRHDQFACRVCTATMFVHTNICIDPGMRMHISLNRRGIAFVTSCCLAWFDKCSCAGAQQDGQAQEFATGLPIDLDRQRHVLLVLTTAYVGKVPSSLMNNCKVMQPCTRADTLQTLLSQLLAQLIWRCHSQCLLLQT